MKCPIDQYDLVQHAYEANIRVDACPHCSSVWLDESELQRIQDTIERDYSDELRRIPDHVVRAYEMARAKVLPTRSCPRCSSQLDRTEYGYCSQILIDMCRQCRGVWLDRGELDALEVFFEKARLDTSDMRQGFFASLLNAVRS